MTLAPVSAFAQPIGGRTDAAAPSGENDQVMSSELIVDLTARHWS
jgi:hypothetical protein